jgi:tetratricopeptide (TPR) repeat protein
MPTRPATIAVLLTAAPGSPRELEETWLARCIELDLREQLAARGLVLADPEESRRLLGPRCSSSPSERVPTELVELFGLVPTDLLIYGHLRHIEGLLSLTLWRLDADEHRALSCLEYEEGRFDAFIEDLTATAFVTLDCEGSRARYTPHPASLEAFLALAEARRCWGEGDLEGAELASTRALRADQGFVAALRFLSEIYRELEDGPRELVMLEQVVTIRRATPAPDELPRSLMELGKTLIRLEHWDRALEVYDEARALFSSRGQLHDATRSRSNRASIFLQRGSPESAIREYLEALETSSSGLRDQPRLLYNLALAQKACGKPRAAIDTLERSLEAARTRHDHRLICRCHNALGALHDERGDLEGALTAYRLAEEYFDASDERTLLAGLKDHIAITYRKQGQHKRALDYSDQAVALIDETTRKSEKAAVYSNRAALMLELDHSAEARGLLARAASLIANESGARAEAIRCAIERLQGEAR